MVATGAGILTLVRHPAFALNDKRCGFNNPAKGRDAKGRCTHQRCDVVSQGEEGRPRYQARPDLRLLAVKFFDRGNLGGQSVLKNLLGSD